MAKSWNVLGDIVTCKLSGKETGGTHSLFHITSPPGNGPPPHIHRREDETFYILEGTFEFVTEGRTIRAGPGEAVYAPRNIAHSFRNVGTTPGQMLLVASPPGLESFFEALDREVGPPPPDMPKLLAVLERFGFDLV